MKLVLVVFLLVVVMITQGYAQHEREPTSDTTPTVHPGIYLTFNNFITNSPINPETIVTDRDPYDADFYFQLFKEGKIEFIQDTVFKTFDPEAIWGYSDGRGVFINRRMFPFNLFDKSAVAEHNYAKINFLGELSLVYFVKAFYGEVSPYGGTSPTNKPAEFILDTRDGQIHKSTLANLQILIANDKELLYEFQKQTGDKELKLYLVLKKYNDRHPFRFR